MKIIDWANSSPDARRAALARPASERREEVFREATAIIAAVRAEGDAAVRRFTKQFGGAALDDLVSNGDIAQWTIEMPGDLLYVDRNAAVSASQKRHIVRNGSRT
jgi:histidinol dehydrogenase